MASEWKLTKISDLCEIVRGASPRPIHDYMSVHKNAIPWVKISDATEIDSRFIYKTKERIREEGRSKSREVFKGDLIVSNSATPGIPRIMNIDACIHDGWLLLSNFINFDKFFCLYAIRYIRPSLLKLGNGSVFTNLKTDILKNFEILLPPLEEQKAIAHILGSLDDKIELNRQMNATLEAMAQALFKSWFVDFDPVLDNALAAGNPIPDELQSKAAARLAVGDARKPLPAEIQALFPSSFILTEEMGWIPEGWEDLNLSSLLEIKYGKDHKALNEGTIPVYGSGGLMRYVDSALFSGESILIPRKGTLSNLMYVNETFWTVDTMFYSVPKLENTAKFLFYFLKTFDFNSMNVGSAVPSMTTKVLNELKVIKPSAVILEAFEKYLSTLFQKNKNLQNENKYLTNLRDTLLPKLLSGELRIPDAENLAAEVL